MEEDPPAGKVDKKRLSEVEKEMLRSAHERWVKAEEEEGKKAVGWVEEKLVESVPEAGVNGKEGATDGAKEGVRDKPTRWTVQEQGVGEWLRDMELLECVLALARPKNALLTLPPHPERVYNPSSSSRSSPSILPFSLLLPPGGIKTPNDTPPLSTRHSSSTSSQTDSKSGQQSRASQALLPQPTRNHKLHQTRCFSSQRRTIASSGGKTSSNLCTFLRLTPRSPR